MKRSLPVCLLLLSFSAYGALSKWVDAEGRVHYSNEPPPGNVRAEVLIIPHDQTSGVPGANTYIELEAELKRTQKAKEEAAQKAAQQQDEALAKQKNCAAAKANLKILEDSPRIITYNDKGESVLMDDSTRQQNLEEARKQIDALCN